MVGHRLSWAAVHAKPDLQLVMVFESSDAITAAMAKGLLEDAGIPFWPGHDEMRAPLALDGVAFPAYRLFVLSDREAEARDLMAPLLSPIETDDSGEEAE